MGKADYDELILDDEAAKIRSNPDLYEVLALSEVVSLIETGQEPRTVVPFSAPAEVDPILYRFVKELRRDMNAEESQVLWPLVNRLLDSELKAADRSAAAYIIADWTVRQAVPLALDKEGFPGAALALRGLAPIVDQETAATSLKYIEVEDINQAAAAEAIFGLPELGLVRNSAEDAIENAIEAGVDRGPLIQMRLDLISRLLAAGGSG